MWPRVEQLIGWDSMAQGPVMSALDVPAVVATPCVSSPTPEPVAFEPGEVEGVDFARALAGSAATEAEDVSWMGAQRVDFGEFEEPCPQYADGSMTESLQAAGAEAPVSPGWPDQAAGAEASCYTAADGELSGDDAEASFRGSPSQARSSFAGAEPRLEPLGADATAQFAEMSDLMTPEAPYGHADVPRRRLSTRISDVTVFPYEVSGLQGSPEGPGNRTVCNSDVTDLPDACFRKLSEVSHLIEATPGGGWRKLSEVTHLIEATPVSKRLADIEEPFAQSISLMMPGAFEKQPAMGSAEAVAKVLQAAAAELRPREGPTLSGPGQPMLSATWQAQPQGFAVGSMVGLTRGPSAPSLLGTIGGVGSAVSPLGTYGHISRAGATPVVLQVPQQLGLSVPSQICRSNSQAVTRAYSPAHFSPRAISPRPNIVHLGEETAAEAAARCHSPSRMLSPVLSPQPPSRQLLSAAAPATSSAAMTSPRPLLSAMAGRMQGSAIVPAGPSRSNQPAQGPAAPVRTSSLAAPPQSSSASSSTAAPSRSSPMQSIAGCGIASASRGPGSSQAALRGRPAAVPGAPGSNKRTTPYGIAGYDQANSAIARATELLNRVAIVQPPAVVDGIDTCRRAASPVVMRTVSPPRQLSPARQMSHGGSFAPITMPGSPMPGSPRTCSPVGGVRPVQYSPRGGGLGANYQIVPAPPFPFAARTVPTGPSFPSKAPAASWNFGGRPTGTQSLDGIPRGGRR